MSPQTFNPLKPLKRSMGLLSNLLFFPITGPVAGIRWSLRKVAQVVDEELTDDSSIKQEMMELQMQVELGDIDDAEYVRRAIAFGVSGYVLKDGPGHQLVEAIDTVFGGGRYFSPGLALPQDPAPPVTRAWGHLTPREAAVLQLLADDRSNKEIASALGASVRTVETHRLHLRRKLRIDGQAALVKYAVDYADLQGGAV